VRRTTIDRNEVASDIVKYLNTKNTALREALEVILSDHQTLKDMLIRHLTCAVPNLVNSLFTVLKAQTRILQGPTKARPSNKQSASDTIIRLLAELAYYNHMKTDYVGSLVHKE
jgi:hypothetical protein